MAGGPLQVQEQSKSQEVKITPEMLAAGVEALRPLEYDLYEQRGMRELETLVRAVYVAMQSHRDRAA